METLHESVYPLFVLAFVLGLRHGMDPDHLATIDGLTRFNAAAGRMRLARLCGFLFSLGHGAVVCVAALVAGVWCFHCRSSRCAAGSLLNLKQRQYVSANSLRILTSTMKRKGGMT